MLSNHYFQPVAAEVWIRDISPQTVESSFLIANSHLPVKDHASKQPPFGEVISFAPQPGSIKKATYQELGLTPRIIYAQDDLRGDGQICDGFTVKDTDTVVFLVGPTYRDTAVSQWRLDIIEKLAPHLPSDTVLVVPQFKYHRFDELPGTLDTQLEWEHQWLERADVVAINLSLYWKNPDGSIGNIGPTTRFEVGYYFAKAHEKKLIVFVPSNPKPDGLYWVYFHAQDLELPIYGNYPDFYQAIMNVCHNRP